jgi:hypothetical protein
MSLSSRQTTRRPKGRVTFVPTAVLYTFKEHWLYAGVLGGVQMGGAGRTVQRSQWQGVHCCIDI